MNCYLLVFIYCNDRTSRWGGVLIAFNNNIRSKLLATPSGHEVLIVEVQRTLTLTSCVAYIPPNSYLYHNEVLAFLDSYASNFTPLSSETSVIL